MKNIAMHYNNEFSKGELVVTKFGIEGNAIYTLSEKIQEELLTKEEAVVFLDLKPTLTLDVIQEKYKRTRTTAITRF